MKRLLFVLFFAAVFVFGLAAKLPLSFVLKAANAPEQGVSWQQARGTIWNGQLTGIRFDGADLGALQVHTNIKEVFSAGSASRIVWHGPGGTATARLKPASDRVKLTDLSAKIALSEWAYLHPELRRAGATLTVETGTLEVTTAGDCIFADGEAELDLMQRLGQTHNRAWPLLRGSPVCANGGFSLPLTGTGVKGEQFDITLVWSRGGQPEAEVKISGLEPNDMLALQALGFIKSGNQLTLRRGAVLAQER